ncbi:hypothetical protein ABMA79_10370 [Halobacteriovorax sp. HFRX-2_2]|uniref:hypothetical protein n=1 Tax=unclassified Halobacteriovorax TaxID=2639665 RepID=UPI0037158886
MSKRLQELLEEMKEYSPKQMRTLRNNLNNRLQSFKNDFKEPKELQPSHKLYGLEEGECRELLGVVKKELIKMKFSDL